MKIRFSFMSIILPALLILPGCGVRKKNLLLKLSPGMTKKAVEANLGKPDEVYCSTLSSNGDIIDTWVYNLATVDEVQENKRTMFQLGGWLLFWPLLCFPSAWQSPYTFDNYFLKFVNNFLSTWGRSFELDLVNSTEGLNK